MIAIVVLIGLLLPFVPLPLTIGWIRVAHPIFDKSRRASLLQGIAILAILVYAVSLVVITNAVPQMFFSKAILFAEHWSWSALGLSSFAAVLLQNFRRLGLLLMLITFVGWFAAIAYFVLRPYPQAYYWSYGDTFASINISVGWAFALLSRSMATNQLEKKWAIGWMVLSILIGIALSLFLKSVNLIAVA